MLVASDVIEVDPGEEKDGVALMPTMPVVIAISNELIGAVVSTSDVGHTQAVCGAATDGVVDDRGSA